MLTSRLARTPTLLQLDAVECGAACLGMILAYHGRHIPLADLRRDCGVSRDGCRASNVVRAARGHGLEARGLRKDVVELRDVATPYVAHWQFNHFVVVEKLGRNHVRLNDPRSGHIRVTREEFDRSFTGVVLEFRPGERFERKGRPPSLSRALAGRVWAHRRALSFGLIAGLVLVVPTLFLAGCASAFIDGVLIDGQRTWMRPLTWILLAAAAAQLALTCLQRRCLRGLYTGATTREARNYLEHLLRLPIAFFAQRHPGEVANRIHYVERVADLLAYRIAESGIQFMTMLVFLATMAWIHFPLAAAILLLSAINVVALWVVFHRRSELSQRMARTEGQWVAASLVGAQMIEPLKASGMESGYLAKWDSFQHEFADARQQLEQSVIGIEALPGLTERLALTALLCLGGWAVIDGSLTLGSLVAFQILLTRFTAPLQSFVSLVAEMQTIHADLLRLDDVRDSERDPLATELCGDENGVTGCPTPDAAPSAKPTLELESLSFGYSPLDPPLLDRIDLSLRAGECLAIVGGSGSGKSTLARLVCGLLVPWSGHVRVGGRDLKEIDRRERINRVAFVDQDVLLFSGSVRDNLTLWNPKTTDGPLWEACADALIDHVVRRLPGGLGGLLEEDGANLSGGEKQRLELARALVSHPDLLVLDEAMSALDTETELRIIESVRRRGCTTLLITHRMSASRACDSILVMDQGRLVGRGTHDELVATCSAYQRLMGTVSGT